jgi:hypothetical protein
MNQIALINSGVSIDNSILLVGLLALLLWSCIVFRNPAGIALWSFTVVLTVLSVVFGFPLELVWIGVLFTAVLTIIGVGVRVSN